MRFMKLMAIGVVLLVLVGGILGTACTGAQGEQGPPGETGATGATGPAGPAGEQGPQGIQGIQGIQGLQGIQGTQGIQGPPGLAGTGVTWQGEWDNVTTYSQDDAVGYLGSSYISNQDANTNHLPTDTAWWDLWAEKGDTGAQGVQGIQGPAGPNMILAMGAIAAGGTIDYGYNVDNCTWNAGLSRYEITLTGIPYWYSNYVTIVTPTYTATGAASYASHATGVVDVIIYDAAGNKIQSWFSFMVLKAS